IGQMRCALLASLIAMIGYSAAAVQSRVRARLLMASSGFVVLLAFALAVGMAPCTTSHSSLGFFVSLVFTGLLLLAMFMDLAAMSMLKGPTGIDVLQFLLLPSILWIWFVGVMTIGHDWL
ncbi:MAG: hypothetical protein M3R20_01095, partial [Pseudomonadota bacterium]|nr:hypothetical protein [Pseudomonadota bacterium]